MVDAGVAVTAVPTDIGVEVGTIAIASQHHHTITVTLPPVHQQGSTATDQGHRGEADGGARGHSMPAT
jgi:hypothetical protein